MARSLFLVAALTVSGDGPSGCASQAPEGQEAQTPGAAPPGPAAPVAAPLPEAPAPPAATDLGAPDRPVVLQGDAEPLVVLVDVAPSMARHMAALRENVDTLIRGVAATTPDRPVEILTFTGAPDRWRGWTRAEALAATSADWLPTLDWCARDYAPYNDPTYSFHAGGAFVHAAPAMQDCKDGGTGTDFYDGGSHPAAALALAREHVSQRGSAGAELVLFTNLKGPRCVEDTDCGAERAAALEDELATVDQAGLRLWVVGLRSREREKAGAKAEAAAQREAFTARYGAHIVGMPLSDR